VLGSLLGLQNSLVRFDRPPESVGINGRQRSSRFNAPRTPIPGAAGAAAHAGSPGWPEKLAAQYLGEILHYEIGSRELEAIELFWKRCHKLALIRELRPVKLYKGLPQGTG